MKKGQHHTEESKRKLRLAYQQKGGTSEEVRQRLSLRRKGIKLTEEVKQKISLGKQNSVKYQRLQEKWRLLRELKQQAKQRAKDAKRREVEARRLQRIALRIYYNSVKIGPSFNHTKEGLERIREANRDKVPWNKGVTAWNNGLPWPDEVKESISKCVVVYWIQKTESKTQIV
jgi:hypothetical protein